MTVRALTQRSRQVPQAGWNMTGRWRLLGLRLEPLEQVVDRVPIPLHRGDMVVHGSTSYAVEVATLVVIGQGQVGDPDRFPKTQLVAPLRLAAGPGRDPRVDADRRRITAGLLGIALQGCNGPPCLLAGRVGKRHPAIAPFGAAAQCHVVVTAIP